MNLLTGASLLALAKSVYYLKFGTKTPAVLNLIVYAEFQNPLEIDRNRRGVYDLSQGA